MEEKEGRVGVSGLRWDGKSVVVPLTKAWRAFCPNREGGGVLVGFRGFLAVSRAQRRQRAQDISGGFPWRAPPLLLLSHQQRAFL